MRNLFFFITICLATLSSIAQTSIVNQINAVSTPEQALAPLRFLASDELMGRSATRPEIHIAARYIAEEFRKSGLKEVAGTTDYFQHFNLAFIKPPTKGSLIIGNKTYTIGNDLLQARGMDLQLTAPIVFANYGSAADLANMDVKGKIVVVNMGENDSSMVNGAGRYREAKQRRLKELGAVAMIERYSKPAADWELPKRGLTVQRSADTLDKLLPVLLLHDPEKQLPLLLNSASTAEINTTGNQLITIPSRNVMGFIAGTDPKLKDEYIVLSAHYDHIGVAASPKTEEGKLDSVYNGARDNAIGVSAIINAGHYFGQHPAKRSILIIAFTAEELGLLGSKYFAANPTIAMNKIVFNLNIDNGGVNDVSKVSIIGLGRTSADDDLKKAARAFGLGAGPDPAPELGLFDRSDNVSFAAKGVPAPSYGMGVSKADESIFRRYHQLSDEIGDLDLNYIVKYIKSYILAAKYIADNPVQPRWKQGDKYEEAWKKLFPNK